MGSQFRSNSLVLPADNEHNFVLVDEIANTGGMASIYRATIQDHRSSDRNGRMVALKIARVEDDNAEIYERLLRRETSMLKFLRYPGIVRVYPFNVVGKQRHWGRATNLDGKPFFFVMELLSKTSLEDIKKASFRDFPLSWRVEVIYQIALALDFLHMAGMAHRDLKPDNVVFRCEPSVGATPQPVLIDFGLAEKQEINPEIKAATLTHAAPEQVEEFLHPDYRPVTTVGMDLAATDVWALGIVAYELVNQGAHPFGEVYKMTKSQLADNILRGRPQPMRSDVPTRLRKAILSLLEYDSTKRPRDSRIH